MNITLIGIEGFLGDGKTAILTRYLENDYKKGRNIICNYELTKIPFKYFDIDEFLTNEENDFLTNATLGIDEITTIADCRLSGSKSNISFGYLVLQSRKRGLDVYYTTQDIGLVDYKRLIKYTQIFVVAQRVYKRIFYDDDTYKDVEIDDVRNYTIIDMRKREANTYSFNLDISSYYDSYDTDRIIKPPNFKNKKDDKIKDMKERIKVLENMIKSNNIKLA